MKQYFDIEKDLNVSFNYRYIQPPQIAYFVTTQDEFNNTNVTPVTLGTTNAATMPKNGRPAEFYLSFSMGTKVQNEEGNYNHPRDGYINLLQSDECVVSFIPKTLMDHSIVANMPYPRGISELDMMGLHEYPSTNITVPSIKECPINIECKIEHRIQLGEYYMLFVAKVVGLSIDEELLQKDIDGLGVIHINPVFEVNIAKQKSNNNRLVFGELSNSYYVPMDEFGSTTDWVGSFQNFIDSEYKKDHLSKDERDEIYQLTAEFKKDRSNKNIKNQLTILMSKLFQ